MQMARGEYLEGDPKVGCVKVYQWLPCSHTHLPPLRGPHYLVAPLLFAKERRFVRSVEFRKASTLTHHNAIQVLYVISTPTIGSHWNLSCGKAQLSDLGRLPACSERPAAHTGILRTPKSESGPLRTVHLSRHEWPGQLVKKDS